MLIAPSPPHYSPCLSDRGQDQDVAYRLTAEHDVGHAVSGRHLQLDAVLLRGQVHVRSDLRASNVHLGDTEGSGQMQT